ncbi:MAG: Ribosome small subunit biogenesis RbfA-release protein RsgA, partial [uncultured Frankineae bacterium]
EPPGARRGRRPGAAGARLASAHAHPSGPRRGAAGRGPQRRPRPLPAGHRRRRPADGRARPRAGPPGGRRGRPRGGRRRHRRRPGRPRPDRARRGAHVAAAPHARRQRPRRAGGGGERRGARGR